MKVNYCKLFINVLRNGEHVEFNDYTKEEHDLSFCWAHQAVNSLKQRWNAHYAKGKRIEVTGHKQSNIMLHKKFQFMTNDHNKLFHNSEYFTVKSFNGETMALNNGTDNSVIVVDLKLTHCVKPVYAITVHACQGMAINQPYSIKRL